MQFELMRRLCGWNFSVIDQAALPGYELGPDGRGYFNIRKKNGVKSFGVLYSIEESCLSTLDEFEGNPGVFNRIEIEVWSGGVAYKAWVYLEASEYFAGTFMNEDYLRRVIAGAVENHLPEEWTEFLKSFWSLVNV